MKLSHLILITYGYLLLRSSFPPQNETFYNIYFIQPLGRKKLVFSSIYLTCDYWYLRQGSTITDQNMVKWCL